jgi:hypothetical protein
MTAEDSQFDSAAGARNLSLLYKVQTGCGAQSLCCTVLAGGCFREAPEGRVVKLTTHIHLVLRLTMLKFHFHVPVHVFMAWYLIS